MCTAQTYWAIREFFFKKKKEKGKRKKKRKTLVAEDDKAGGKNDKFEDTLKKNRWSRGCSQRI